MDTFFKGQTVLITGASSGIGRALALQLADKGCRLALVARRGDALSAVSKDIIDAGGTALSVVCDVTDPAAVKAAYEKIVTEIGHPTTAFLNAGIGSSCIGQNVSSQEIEQVMKTNFFGAVYWLDYLLPPMQKRNQGTIVGISSLAAYRGLPGTGSYAASKAALSTIFESYQIDFLATNLRFVTVCPYFVASQMSGVSDDDVRGVWVSSYKAAQIITEGVAKGKRYIAFPWMFRSFMALMRTLPLWAYRLFWKFAKRGG